MAKSRLFDLGSEYLQKGQDQWNSYFKKWELLAQDEDEIEDNDFISADVMEEVACKTQPAKAIAKSKQNKPVPQQKKVKFVPSSKKVLRRKKTEKPVSEQKCLVSKRNNTGKMTPTKKTNKTKSAPVAAENIIEDEHLEADLRSVISEFLKASSNQSGIFSVLTRTFSNSTTAVGSVRFQSVATEETVLQLDYSRSVHLSVENKQCTLQPNTDVNIGPNQVPSCSRMGLQSVGKPDDQLEVLCHVRNGSYHAGRGILDTNDFHSTMVQETQLLPAFSDVTFGGREGSSSQLFDLQNLKTPQNKRRLTTCFSENSYCNKNRFFPESFENRRYNSFSPFQKFVCNRDTDFGPSSNRLMTVYEHDDLQSKFIPNLRVQNSILAIEPAKKFNDILVDISPINNSAQTSLGCNQERFKTETPKSIKRFRSCFSEDLHVKNREKRPRFVLVDSDDDDDDVVKNRNVKINSPNTSLMISCTPVRKRNRTKAKAHNEHEDSDGCEVVFESVRKS